MSGVDPGQGLLGDIGSGYNIYQGATSGTPLGQTRAALQAAKLYSNLSGDSSFSSPAGSALGALNFYSGIKQGGVAGDTSAALAADQLANQGAQAAGYSGVGADALSGVAQYAPLIGEALGMYGAVSAPSVELGPSYWNRLEQGLNSPVGSNDWNSSAMEMAASNNPAELAALHARGIQTGSATDNLQAWQLVQPPGQPYGTSNSARPFIRQASGGYVANNLKKRLQELYAGGSFDKRPRHYDDGGYVNYYNPAPADTGSYDFMQPDTGQQGAPSSTPQFVPQYDQSQGQAASAYENAGGGAGTYYGNNSSSNSILGQGGALSGLGSLLGVSSIGDLVKQYGALAPLIAAAVGGGNKGASPPATPSGYGAIPSIPTPNFSRPYTQPNVPNWYTYGQGPEQNFFGNNQLPYVPGVSPSSAAPATQPSGQSTGTQSPYMGGKFPGLQLRAQGGSTFDSTQGDSYVQDPGAGDGTSDDIDAKLSGGEYVMDAGTVSMLGNGSNEAGARALDQLRQRVRQHAGKHLVKGKQFMKAKAPEAYLKGGKS